MKRKKSYKQLLLIYFGAVVGVFLLVASFLELRNEQNYKTVIMKTRLEGYADRVKAYGHDALSFSEEVRITELSLDGKVLFDSQQPELSADHSGRPEITDCTDGQPGWAIRKSDTQGREYCYLAKQYDDRIIRVAVPYEVDLKNFFRPNTAFIIAGVLLLLFVLFFLGIAMLKGYRSLEIALDEIEKEKETNKRLKHEMTHNIAHELRTPVSSMRGYLEMLTDCDDLDVERRRLYTQRAYAQSLRLSDLLRDISLVTKIEEAPQLIKKEEICLWDIFDSVYEEFSSKLIAAGIKVENMIPHDLTIVASGSLTYSIFRNLVENSLKYAGDGVTVHIEVTRGEGMLEFRYYDTGRGVPAEMFDRIFERFVHYSASEKSIDSTTGSGLGLSVVRNAVRFHGGDIYAKQHMPSGLEFVFTMKL